MSGPDLRIALALGSGGARGFAHIVAFETFDRLGLRPVEIAGTSMGAILGAAYAAGMSGKAMRQHFLHGLRNRTDVMSRLFQTRIGKFSDILRQGLANPVLLDGEKVLDAFLPGILPDTFESLDIPLAVVAADIHRLEKVTLNSGLLKPALAGSMAIPGLIRPAVHAGKVMIDGGAIDPLPIQALQADVDLIIAIDISRGSQREESESVPGMVEVLTRAFDIMQLSLVEAQRYRPPAPLHRIKARVSQFGALDFFSIRQILRASEPIASEIETIIEALRRTKAIAAPQKTT